jgi:hypothetical protein
VVPLDFGSWSLLNGNEAASLRLYCRAQLNGELMLELVVLFAAGFFFGYLVRALRSRRRRYRRLHLPPQGVRLDPMKKAE